MSLTKTWKRLALASAALALMPIGSALSQDRGEQLILKSRRIGVSIDENLAIVTYSFSVLNPTSRLMEGRVTFEAPAGAVGCELTLLRNISSRDRAGRVMEPRFAAAVYEAVRQHDLSFDTVDDLGRLKAGEKGKPVVAKEGESLKVEGASKGTIHFEVTPEPEPSPAPRRQAGDPALLESSGGDSYRLRFFPVPAYCDETVTAVFAVELRGKGDGYALTLPLTADSSFAKSATTTEEFGVTLVTQGRITSLVSRTHALPAKAVGGSRAGWSQPIDGKFRTLQLAYGLDAAAKPWDFRQAFNEASIVPPRGLPEVDADRAFQSVMARRLVSALATESSTSTAKAAELAGKAKIATPWSSLVVIEQWQLDEASKSGELQRELRRENLENARGCDYVRGLAGLPKVGRGGDCGLHLVQTTSAERIAEAQKKGWRTWPSKELPTFTCIEVVRHGDRCTLHEQGVEELQRIAAMLGK